MVVDLSWWNARKFINEIMGNYWRKRFHSFDNVSYIHISGVRVSEKTQIFNLNWSWGDFSDLFNRRCHNRRSRRDFGNTRCCRLSYICIDSSSKAIFLVMVKWSWPLCTLKRLIAADSMETSEGISEHPEAEGNTN